MMPAIYCFRRIFLSAIFLILCFFVSPLSVFSSDNLIQNSGFEELLYNWTPSSGLDLASNFTISSFAKTGQSSALVKHSKTGSYGAAQIIKSITGGDNYIGKGYVFFNNDKAKNARLRIAWYSSDNGSGSQIKTVDSNIITDKSPSWQELNTDTIEAPSTAKSCEFRILLASSSENDESFVYFDDLFFGLAEEGPSPSILVSSPTTTSQQKAVYKIGEVKNSSGTTLSSVKIYIDGVYTNHYAPETFTFCDGCSNGGFGQHTIKLEKAGYQEWSETRSFNSGDNYEISPQLAEQETSSSPVPSSSVASSPKTASVLPKASVKISPSPKSSFSSSVSALASASVSPSSSSSAQVLGTQEEQKNFLARVISSPIFIPLVLVTVGIGFMAVAFAPLALQKLKENGILNR